MKMSKTKLRASAKSVPSDPQESRKKTREKPLDSPTSFRDDTLPRVRAGPCPGAKLDLNSPLGGFSTLFIEGAQLCSNGRGFGPESGSEGRRQQAGHQPADWTAAPSARAHRPSEGGVQCEAREGGVRVRRAGPGGGGYGSDPEPDGHTNSSGKPSTVAPPARVYRPWRAK